MTMANEQLELIVVGKCGSKKISRCPACNMASLSEGHSKRSVSGHRAMPGLPAIGKMCSNCGHIYAVVKGNRRNYTMAELQLIRAMPPDAVRRIREQQASVVERLIG